MTLLEKEDKEKKLDHKKDAWCMHVDTLLKHFCVCAWEMERKDRDDQPMRNRQLLFRFLVR